MVFCTKSSVESNERCQSQVRGKGLRYRHSGHGTAEAIVIELEISADSCLDEQN